MPYRREIFEISRRFFQKIICGYARLFHCILENKKI